MKIFPFENTFESDQIAKKYTHKTNKTHETDTDTDKRQRHWELFSELAT